MVVVFTEPLVNLFEVFDLSCARVSAALIRNKLHACFLNFDGRKVVSWSFLNFFHDLIFLLDFSFIYELLFLEHSWEFPFEAGVCMSELFLLAFALVVEGFAEPADVCSIGDTAAILLVDGNLLSGALICFEHFWKLIIRIVNMSLFEQLQI